MRTRTNNIKGDKRVIKSVRKVGKDGRKVSNRERKSVRGERGGRPEKGEREEGRKRVSKTFRSDKSERRVNRFSKERKERPALMVKRTKREIEQMRSELENREMIQSPHHRLHAQSYTPRKRNPKAKDEEGVRLNKYIANSGLCSRREADEYILEGLITINGEVVTELGTKVYGSDEVRYDGSIIKGEQKVYILMNKPKDFITTTSDPHAQKTVLDLIAGRCKERVYPVGRLDRDTTGVLLITNDGDLTKRLTHPSFNKKKIYQVTLDRKLKSDDFEKVLKGVYLEDGIERADALSYIDGDESVVGIEIHSGKNRVVRRIFESLGYKVKKLDRVFFAGLTKKNLRRGQWRFLTDKEVQMLMMGAFE